MTKPFRPRVPAAIDEDAFRFGDLIGARGF
jgi:hypothetical protein